MTSSGRNELQEPLRQYLSEKLDKQAIAFAVDRFG
jgi:hypothetical protein